MTGRVSTRAIIVPGLSLGEFLGSDSRLSVGGFLVWPQGTYVFEYSLLFVSRLSTHLALKLFITSQALHVSFGVGPGSIEYAYALGTLLFVCTA